jgi:hypothetical protein
VITKLNLSSHPFRNRALPWTITAIVTIFSVASLIFIAKWTFDTNAKAQTAARDVAQLRQQAEGFKKQALALKTAFTPEQQRALKSAHELVGRKQFSWSRLLADLESALPGTVRVTRIAVKEVGTQDNRTVANLQLVVASKNPATVTQMIQDMEREGIFHPQLVSQNAAKGEASQEYEMIVFYVPRASVSIPPADQNQRAVDTANGGAGQR